MLLGDLRALRGEKLIDFESELQDLINFNITAKGYELAAALTDVRASGGKEPRWVAAGLESAPAPLLTSSRSKSAANTPQVWGDRWVALAGRRSIQRGQGHHCGDPSFA